MKLPGVFFDLVRGATQHCSRQICVLGIDGEVRIGFRGLEIDSSFQARFFQASLKHGKLASQLREFTSA